tara:strand:- start:791 stop:943 length:153 start_codon:yes stop_codon:yes gene_type:complete
MTLIQEIIQKMDPIDVLEILDLSIEELVDALHEDILENADLFEDYLEDMV